MLSDWDLQSQAGKNEVKQSVIILTISFDGARYESWNKYLIFTTIFYLKDVPLDKIVSHYIEETLCQQKLLNYFA